MIGELDEPEGECPLCVFVPGVACALAAVFISSAGPATRGRHILKDLQRVRAHWDAEYTATVSIAAEGPSTTAT